MSHEVFWYGSGAVSESRRILIETLADRTGAFADYRAAHAPVRSLQAPNGFAFVLAPAGRAYAHPFDSLADLIVVAQVGTTKGSLGALYQFSAESFTHRQILDSREQFKLPAPGPKATEQPVQKVLNAVEYVQEPRETLPFELYLPHLIATVDAAYPRDAISLGVPQLRRV